MTTNEIHNKKKTRETINVDQPRNVVAPICGGVLPGKNNRGHDNDV